MIARVLLLAGGVLGGASASQFPEFSQQYTQRLGGAVDALSEVVADFDASATASGLDRVAALDQMRGSAFLERRRIDMARTFERFERLSDDLEVMQGAGPFMRAYHAARMTDGDVAKAAMETYQPAVPLSFAGITFAGAGFVTGLLAFWAVLKMLMWPFRRSPRHARTKSV